MNTSFPVPELDAIGLEPITVAYYSNNPIELPSTGGITDAPTTTVGYLPLSSKSFSLETALGIISLPL